MSTLLFSNNAGSTLSGAITNTATSLSLASGGGALFPNPTSGQYFIITAIDAATGLLREIMWCTARSTDTLTVTRAQEGTTALNWNAGDLIQSLVTAGMMGQFIQQGTVPTSNIFAGLTDTGGVNTIVTTVTPTLTALANGLVFEIQPAHTNTIAGVTMNISSLGALTCYRSDGTGLQPGDLVANGRYLFSYDSTANAFFLLNPNTWNSKPQVTVLTSGSGTYTTPTGAAYLAVEMVGGGSGGSSAAGGASTAGGATTFGTSLLTANGGAAAVNSFQTPATATGGDINVSGALGAPGQDSSGTGIFAAGNGAASAFGGGGPGGVNAGTGASAVAYGSGGGGGPSGASPGGTQGWGGNAGGFLKKLITSPASSYSYAVGAGGAGAGTGGAGAGGLIAIVAHFQ